MSISDSLFLVEIIVEELKSFIACKEFIIKGEFADVFSVILKDPSEFSKLTKKKKVKRKPKQTKPGLTDKSGSKCLQPQKIISGESVLFVDNFENLMKNMNAYPIELSLWSKTYPEFKIASTSIPWNENCIDYLKKLSLNREPVPFFVQGEYNVFDEYTSRRMAVIKLSIKLSHLSEKIRDQFRTLTSQNPGPMTYSGISTLSKNTSTVTLHKRAFNYAEDTGIIKTIYSGGKKKFKKHRNKKSKTAKEIKESPETVADKKPKSHLNNENDNKTLQKMKNTNKTSLSKCKVESLDEELMETDSSFNKVDNSLISLVKSDLDIDKGKQIDLIKSKSCSSIHREQFNILNYIFGNAVGPYGNQVYCVNYCTVDKQDNPVSTTSSKTKVPSVNTSKTNSPTLSTSKTNTVGKEDEMFVVRSPKEHMHLRICVDDCPKRLSYVSLDIKKDDEEKTEVTKCKDINCLHKNFRPLPAPPDDQIFLKLDNKCCLNEGDKIEKVEEVVGEMQAKMKVGKEDDPCYCECECRFGFTKKTTYCKICGGYEKPGEELNVLDLDKPHPCPIFHNLEPPKPSPTPDTKKSVKPAKSTTATESEKDSKKSKKNRTYDKNKFKFNYGYTGIPPQIGHSQCGLPCAGHLGKVPRKMGWLWDSDNVPGMKFRPSWRPGAINKHVLRLLKMAAHPGEVFVSKKRRKKDAGKLKKPVKRPLLVVHKKEGEYTVTMETMKTYPKPRAINQMPYEDKPELTYTIGRTDEENRQRRKKKERAARRLEREQREFIQSAFRDMCKEICLKTYQQALGILQDTERPDCYCYPAEPGPDDIDLDHSCSCSEDRDLTGSDTDSDEWFVEFTPPSAFYDSTYKGKKTISQDNTTQYTYLDYRVKLLDRYGNPVPRFFIGPNGCEECSDLGGFWSPDKKWLEINVDGYIAPDGRWAPNIFIGPNGENVEAELGKFQTMDQRWLVVGIDGFVDPQGRWKFYPKRKLGSVSKSPPKGRPVPTTGKKEAGDMKSETRWSCFGDAGPKLLSEMGILGHGHNRKLLLHTLNQLIAQGENIKIPKPSSVPRSGQRGPGKKGGKPGGARDFAEDRKCKHQAPSGKGIIVDERGRKKYFKMKAKKSKRPEERLETLTGQGISVAQGWKPGAISKRLLRQLENAKLNPLPTKKLHIRKKVNKKRVADKPTLIICKINGEYHVEMQRSPEGNDSNTEQCGPLIYKIKTEGNEERVRKHLKKRQRIIDKAVKEVWSDPYHPEICEKTCLQAYYQAIGVLPPSDPNNPECTCSHDEVAESFSVSSDDSGSSGGSSLDLQWEIHFTPPIASANVAK